MINKLLNQRDSNAHLRLESAMWYGPNEAGFENALIKYYPDDKKELMQHSVQHAINIYIIQKLSLILSWSTCLLDNDAS